MLLIGGLLMETINNFVNQGMFTKLHSKILGIVFACAVLACSALPSSFALAEDPNAIIPEATFASASASETNGADVDAEIKAKISEIVSDEVVDHKRQMSFFAESEDGIKYFVDSKESYTEGVRFDLRVGDVVMLQLVPNADGTETAFLSNVYRLPSLYILIALFAVLIVVIGRWRGASALVGLGLTVVVLFAYVFPTILGGGNPLFTVIVGSVLILGVNMHLSHGFSKGTLLAYLSTLGGLALAVAFSYFAVSFAHLSGLASEDAAFLYWLNDVPLDVRGILLGAIILGATGVLDDIAITQGETVAELHSVDSKLTRKELYRRAMRVGRHHIASTVNTLVLAYVGAAMPLMLLFLATQGVSWGQFLNTEQVAEEIVRTLAGTSALVLTVPLATLLATFATHTGESKSPHIH